MKTLSPTGRPSSSGAACLSFLSRLNQTWHPRAALSLLAAGAMVHAARAETLYLLTDDNMLASTTTARPVAVAPRAITGVTPGETLVAIDVRPQNQQLYALGVDPLADTATLYRLSPETGHAGVVGTAGGIAFTTTGGTPVDFPDPATVQWDIDFNPAVDRLRVVAGSLNFRVNPNNGEGVDADAVAAGTNPDGDVNDGTTTVDGAAYTNSQPNNGGITTLYTLDGASNSLFIQNPPNDGTQVLVQAVTLAGAPLDFTTHGFDIAPGVDAPASNDPATGVGFALLEVGGVTALYTVDLTTAAATSIGGTFNVRSFAVRTELGAAISLSATGDALLRYNVETPGDITTVPITGILVGETLVGIDFRPQTGQLMALGVNALIDTATLYRIDPQTGAGVVVGAPALIQFVDALATPVDFPDPAVSGWGFDFNPTVDRIRVVTSTGLNFRVNPDTGAPVDGDPIAAGTNPDGDINSEGVVGVSGAAYTNAYPQILSSGVTTQYTLDDVTDALYIQNLPNEGTQTVPLPIVLNGNPLDIGSVNGFDIPPSVSADIQNNPAAGDAWFAASVGGSTGLYRVNLYTGEAVLAGLVGDGTTAVQGLTVNASPGLVVESPENTVLAAGLDTIEFGSVAPGQSATRMITIRNTGSQTLAYNSVYGGTSEFSVDSGAGFIPPGGVGIVTITYQPTDTGLDTVSFRIVSNDAAARFFDIDLEGASSLGDDAVAATTSGPTRLNVLANDELGPNAMLTAVSDPLIVIDGRSLIIPAGYTGSFTYTVMDGAFTGMGTVTVTAGVAAISPTTYTGLLFTSTGDIVGTATASISVRNVATISLVTGTVKTKAKVTLPDSAPPVSASVYTNVGYVNVMKNPANNVDISIAALGGLVGGTLLPTVAPAAATKYHVALASLDSTYPGGGYAIANVSKKGAVKVTGLLPDGTAFSGATSLRDNGTIPIYSVVTKAKPPGFVGGELVTADLPLTDITGELNWFKLPQLPKVKGLHLAGVNPNVLAANGSIYNGTALGLEGASATLTLSGGNLASPEVNAVVVSPTGIPPVPTGSLRKWTGVKVKTGLFKAEVAVPTVTKPAKGSGLYLPKAARAWGFFPGTTEGGRIDLRD